MPLEQIAPTPPEPDREAEAREAERRRCAVEYAKAHGAVEGAEARAGLYTPAVIAGLSVGVTGKMLADVMNGAIHVRHAKDAIEVAKIALEIARTDWSTVIPAGATATVGGDTSREKLIAAASDVLANIRQRAQADLEQNADPDADLSEFDLDDEDAAPPRLRSVPSRSA